MMVVYLGDVNVNAVFDPTMLSAAFGQVKSKNKADTTAKRPYSRLGYPVTQPTRFHISLFYLNSAMDLTTSQLTQK